jgi:hypothetical protein
MTGSMPVQFGMSPCSMGAWGMAARSDQPVTKLLNEWEGQRRKKDGNYHEINSVVSEVPSDPRITFCTGEQKNCQEEQDDICHGANGAADADEHKPADE